MGLFDFLFGSRLTSNVEVLNDRIWMTQKAKLHGIEKELEQPAFMGSVAENVVRTASCPVLTVRPEGHQFVMP